MSGTRLAGGRLARRLLAAVATILACSAIVFVALNATSGDPVPLYAANAELTPEAVAEIRAEHHLDDPLPARYVRWLGDAATGDLGRSIQFRQDVGGLVAARLPTTLLLVALAAAITLLAGVALGVLAAVGGRLADRVVVLATSAATAIPTFVAATVLLALFAVELGWFPVFGDGEGLGDRLWHLALPALALALHPFGIVARVTRAAMREQAGREHVEVARSRGLGEATVVRRHVLRNALGPIVTVGGLEVASLLGGSVIVETAFGLNGVGALLVQSVEAKDFAIVQALVLLIVTGFVLVNLAADALQAKLEPRAWTEPSAEPVVGAIA